VKIRAPSPAALAGLLVTLASCSLADRPEKVLDAAGFRPGSEQAAAFLERLPTSRIAVLPGIVRTREGNAFATATRKSALEFLTRHRLGRPAASKLEPDLGAPRGKAQYQLFQNDMATLGRATAGLDGCDDSLTLVFLVTPTPDGGIAIGGIHVYLLDAKGRDTFSFLLNSHHKAFVEARLRAPTAGPEPTAQLVAKATGVALDALLDQLEAARKAEP